MCLVTLLLLLPPSSRHGFTSSRQHVLSWRQDLTVYSCSALNSQRSACTAPHPHWPLVTFSICNIFYQSVPSELFCAFVLNPCYHCFVSFQSMRILSIILLPCSNFLPGCYRAQFAGLWLSEIHQGLLQYGCKPLSSWPMWLQKLSTAFGI